MLTRRCGTEFAACPGEQTRYPCNPGSSHRCRASPAWLRGGDRGELAHRSRAIETAFVLRRSMPCAEGPLNGAYSWGPPVREDGRLDLQALGV
jgi:hypothetical protein